jgi:hypothetical protein
VRWALLGPWARALTSASESGRLPAPLPSATLLQLLGIYTFDEIHALHRPLKPLAEKAMEMMELKPLSGPELRAARRLPIDAPVMTLAGIEAEAMEAVFTDSDAIILRCIVYASERGHGGIAFKSLMDLASSSDISFRLACDMATSQPLPSPGESAHAYVCPLLFGLFQYGRMDLVRRFFMYARVNPEHELCWGAYICGTETILDLRDCPPARGLAYAWLVRACWDGHAARVMRVLEDPGLWALEPEAKRELRDSLHRELGGADAAWPMAPRSREIFSGLLPPAEHWAELQTGALLFMRQPDQAA